MSTVVIAALQMKQVKQTLTLRINFKTSHYADRNIIQTAACFSQTVLALANCLHTNIISLCGGLMKTLIAMQEVQ